MYLFSCVKILVLQTCILTNLCPCVLVFLCENFSFGNLYSYKLVSLCTCVLCVLVYLCTCIFCVLVYFCRPRVSKCHGLRDVCQRKMVLTLCKIFRFLHANWKIHVFHPIFLFVGIFLFSSGALLMFLAQFLAILFFYENFNAQKQQDLECLLCTCVLVYLCCSVVLF